MWLYLQLEDRVRYAEAMKELGDEMETLGDKFTHGKQGRQSIVRSKTTNQPACTEKSWEREIEK